MYQFGFNSPSNKHPEFPGFGLDEGLEIRLVSGITGAGLGPVLKGKESPSHNIGAELQAFETTPCSL